MRKTINNDKGASLVYVLIALVFVGAIAMLVLNSARKETIDSSLRASSEMARFAATSGLTLASTFLANPEATIPAQGITSFQLLRNLYLRSEGLNAERQPLPADESRLPLEAQRWILGNANEFFTDDNGFRFRVRVMNIDFSRVISITEEIPESGTPPIRQFRNNRNLGDSYITVQLQSEAIDASGSRARNIGIFQIFGYENQIDVDALLTHALHLGDGNIILRCPITINGPAFIGGIGSAVPAINFSTNVGHRSHFNGELILRQRDIHTSIIRNTDFGGAAFFNGGGIDIRGATTENNFFGGMGGTSIFTIETGNVRVRPNPIILADGSRERNSVIFTNPITVPSDISHGRFMFEANNNTDLVSNNPAFRWNGNNLGHAFWTGNPNTPRNFQGSTENDRMDEIIEALRISNINPPAPRIVLTPEILARAIPINHDDAPNPQHNCEPNSGHVRCVNGALNETALNNLWLAERNAGRLFTDNAGRQWLVLDIDGVIPLGSNETTFNHRAIIISRGATGDAAGFFGGFPRVANNGNVLFFLNEDADASFSANMLSGSFRGMFYNASPNLEINLSAGNTGWTVNGAFYYAPQATGTTDDITGHIRLGDGLVGRITVNHNRAALREFEEMGIVIPAEDDGDERINLQQIPLNLNARGTFTELLNRSF
jgi:hypothetical protein